MQLVKLALLLRPHMLVLAAHLLLLSKWLQAS
jgi:hypothetical protein